MIEVDVGLETDLPVAEEHVVLSLAVVLVLPFRRVGLRSPLPVVVLCPADAVIEHLWVVQQFIHFDVTCVIGSIVPERTHFSGVVRLPVGVHFPDDILHPVSSPLLGLNRCE